MQRPLALLSLVILASAPSAAGIPQTLAHQGRIASGGVNFDGTGQFKFLLYHGTAPGTVSTPLWKNDDPAPAGDTEPSTAVSTPVTKGLYSIHLGAAPQAALPPSIVPPSGQDLYLRIWFDDGVKGSQQLSPDQAIASVPFAMRSGQAAVATSVAEGSITAAALAPSLSIPSIQSGVIQSFPPGFNVSFTTPFTTAPIVTTTPTAGFPSHVFNTSSTGFSGAYTIPEGYFSQEVDDSSGNTSSSVAMVDGRPAIAWKTSSRVEFFINTNVDGSGSWTRRIVASGSFFSVSLAVIGGKPAVAYSLGGASPNLYCSISSSADGSGSWTQYVAVGGMPSSELSLAEIDGRPAIAYRDGSAGLRFVINSSSDGSGVWTDTFADSSTASGQSASLMAVDGRPAIAHSTGVFTPELKFSINANAAGTGAWTTTTVSNAKNSFGLVIADGRPAIGYLGGATGIGFAINANPSGSGGWTFSTVHTSPDAIVRPSLAVVDGRPGVAFENTTQSTLEFAHSSSTDGAGEWSVMTLASGGTGRYCSLGAVGGRPVIGYYDQVNSKAKAWVPQSLSTNWIAVGQ